MCSFDVESMNEIIKQITNDNALSYKQILTKVRSRLKHDPPKNLNQKIVMDTLIFELVSHSK